MALNDTFGNYQNELGRACEDGRHNVQRMKREIPTMFNDVTPKKSFIMEAIQDTSRVSTSQRLVLEVFAWSSVLVLGSSIGSVLGAYILSPFIGLLFGKYISCLIGYILIPITTHSTIRRKERNYVNDNNIRMMMLVMSVLQGIFAGYTINSRYLESQPVPFVAPVAISFGYAGIVDHAKGDRVKLIGASLMAGLIANIILGALYGVLTLSYLFLTFGYVAIGGVVLQLVFHKAHDHRGHVYQNMLNASYILFKGLTFYLFGSYID